MAKKIYAPQDLLLVQSTMLDEEDDEIAPQAGFVAWTLESSSAAPKEAAPTRKPLQMRSREFGIGGGRSLESLMGSAPAARKQKGRRKGAKKDAKKNAVEKIGGEDASATSSAGTAVRKSWRDEGRVNSKNHPANPERMKKRNQRGAALGNYYNADGDAGDHGDAADDDGGSFFQDLNAAESRDSPWRKPDMVPFDFTTFGESVAATAESKPLPPAGGGGSSNSATGPRLGQRRGNNSSSSPAMPNLLQTMFREAAAVQQRPTPAPRPEPIAHNAMPSLLQSMFMAAAQQPAVAAGASSGSSVFDTAPRSSPTGGGSGGRGVGGAAPLGVYDPSQRRDQNHVRRF